MKTKCLEMATLVLACLGPIVTPRSPVAAQESAVSGERADAIHLLNRATYGPRTEDIERVLDLGVDGWLEEQLHPDRIADPSVAEVARRFPLTVSSIDDLLRAFPPGMVLQPLRQLVEDESLTESERSELRRELGRVSPGRILGELAGSRIYRSAYSERQLEEMMTAFWFDHFNVYFPKGATRWLVGDYEQTAIRPHVFGTFEDMLVATAEHPAMLFYLDNFRSAAPDSSEMARRSRGSRPRLDRLLRQRAGLNENYARELLELHTMGVEGGYTQEDVVNVARVFTGWTFAPPGNREMLATVRGNVEGGDRRIPQLDFDGAYRFQFRPMLHDSGEKVVLGETFSRGGQQDEGYRVLDMLASHPATARHIATQLATRFVADDPPEALIEELAEVFLATDGDLHEVTRTLFTSEYFYAAEHHRGRVKSPLTLVASTLRLTGADLVAPRGALEALRTLGEAPYLAEAPTGYEEASSGWADSGSLLHRMNLGVAVASGSVRGVRLDGAQLLERASAESEDVIEGLAAVLLPGADTRALVETIKSERGRGGTMKTELGRGGPVDEAAAKSALGLVLGSPEFQRH